MHVRDDPMEVGVFDEVYSKSDLQQLDSGHGVKSLDLLELDLIRELVDLILILIFGEVDHPSLLPQTVRRSDHEALELLLLEVSLSSFGQSEKEVLDLEVVTDVRHESCSDE